MEQLQASWAFNVGFIAYALAAVGYLLLAALLATSWRGRLQGGILLTACSVSVIWSAVLAQHAAYGHPPSVWIFLVELCRNGLLLLFLIRLLSPDEVGSGILSWRLPPGLKLIAYSLLGLWLLLAAIHISALTQGVELRKAGVYELRLPGHLILSIFGLALVEQIFRYTQPQQRWAIKYLCFGMGGLFVYDFFLYSDAMLVDNLDPNLWDARGFIQLLVIPLVAISAARNPKWSVEVFVSRGVVFHTVAIIAAGAYLLLMAVGGYFIRYWGGEWGVIGQVIFLFGAVFVLLALFFSGQLRARFRVFINKHFFNYKYDYRDEWLNFIGALSDEEIGTRLQERTIQALAKIVDSPGGALWLREGGRNRYMLVTDWNALVYKEWIDSDDLLVNFLVESKWLIDLNEYKISPGNYEGFELPAWLADLHKAWIILPLFQNKELFGFVLLNQSRAPREINWEDRDLLKTAAQQAASYLALAEASSELANARQFEAFNRLSAYVVHDLKNVVGQLSLVVSNANKFKNNQEFMEDAMTTVANAVSKMQRMLAQLRQGREVQHAATSIRLLPVVEAVVQRRASAKPVPVIAAESSDQRVVAEKDRLGAVVEHIVQNAQEATPDNGYVEIRIYEHNGYAIIEIKDNGSGMDEQFIRERLFRPFDTTKGNAGMGIGVYECREFVRALGGDVEVSSQLGHGSQFRLLIPLA